MYQTLNCKSCAVHGQTFILRGGKSLAQQAGLSNRTQGSKGVTTLDSAWRLLFAATLAQLFWCCMLALEGRTKKAGKAVPPNSVTPWSPSNPTAE